MAGRPTDPNYTVPPWAPDTNYPAGADPWSSTPCKVSHAGASSVGFTPKAGVPAQAVNKLIYDAYSADSSARTLLYGIYQYLINVPALNWNTKVSVGSGANDVAWNNADRYWYSAGGTDNIKKSKDGGQTWAAVALGGAAGTHVCYTLGINPAGEIVVLTDATNIYEMNASGTWTNVAAAIAAAPNAAARSHVVWSPTSSLWLILAATGSGIKAATSANRTAWTNRTGALSSDAGAHGCGINITANRIITVKLAGTTTVALAKSDDGGVTWANLTTITTGSATSATDPADIFYDTKNAVWYVTIPVGSASEIWKSTDNGANWTRIVNGQFNAYRIVADGDLVVGYSLVGELFFSTNGGTTWYASQHAPAVPSRLRFNGCRIMGVTSTGETFTNVAANLPAALF